jgi:protein-S-isoprenylcysteine O-methyltransferase Ste14
MTRDREPIRAGGIGSAVARDRLLPGQATHSMIEEGPYRLSRNPLYVGLLALYLGLALLAPTFWRLVLFPAAELLVLWGAMPPEERFLHKRFGAPYDDYTRRVRRWLWNTTDLQQELPEAHLPLVERCAPYCDGLF